MYLYMHSAIWQKVPREIIRVDKSNFENMNSKCIGGKGNSKLSDLIII